MRTIIPYIPPLACQKKLNASAKTQPNHKAHPIIHFHSHSNPAIPNTPIKAT